MTESRNTSSGPNWLDLDAELVSRETVSPDRIEHGSAEPTAEIEDTPNSAAPGSTTGQTSVPVTPVTDPPILATEAQPDASLDRQSAGYSASSEDRSTDAMSAAGSSTTDGVDDGAAASSRSTETLGSLRSHDPEGSAVMSAPTRPAPDDVAPADLAATDTLPQLDDTEARIAGGADPDVSRETQNGVAAEALLVPDLVTADAEPSRDEYRTGPPPEPPTSVGQDGESRETETALLPGAATAATEDLGFASPESTPPGDHETPIARETAQAIRALNVRQERWPGPERTRVMTVANQKGGVGKTTSAVNIAAALALHGLRVLLIDLDPQGNASTALGIEHGVGTPSIYDVLLGGELLADVAQVADFAPTLRCVPATLDLAGADIELASQVAREYRLQRALLTFLESGHADVDYVIIDCPPSLGLLTLNALVAAREVLLPIQCEYYALEGLAQLLKTVDLVTSHLNPDLVVTTVLLTMYDSRTRLADQVADEVRRHFGDLVLEPTIPRNVRVSEAPGFGQTVITYDPGSRGAVGYVQAALEIAERGARGDHNSVGKPAEERH